MQAGGLDLEGQHWGFALKLYAQPGVAQACLDLQEHAGVDVIVLLACLYAAQVLGRAVSRDRVAQMEATISAWRTDAVRPLRKLRQNLKTGPAPAPQDATEKLREIIKRAELAAEQIELAALAAGLENLEASSGSQNAQLLITDIVRVYAESTGREDIAANPGIEVAIAAIAAGAVRTPAV
jgi:uncharacterized protein (TIGR02444 family)